MHLIYGEDVDVVYCELPYTGISDNLFYAGIVGFLLLAFGALVLQTRKR